MTDWMPGADRDPAAGGTMEGQGWRSVVFHTSESGRDPGAIRGVANWVKSQGSEYHLLWNPWTGELLQLIPASQSARALRNAPGGYRTNRKGTRLIQVCIVGRTADRPLAGGSPLNGWEQVRAWLDSEGVPHHDRTDPNRSAGKFQQSGVHRHRDAPGNDHTDPGPIDFALLYGDAPAPEPEPGEEEHDMRIITAPKKGSGLYGPGYFKPLTDEQRNVLKGQGVVEKNGNDREFDVIRAAVLQGITADDE